MYHDLVCALNFCWRCSSPCIVTKESILFSLLNVGGKHSFSPHSLTPIRKLLQFFSLCNCLLIVYVNRTFVGAEGFDFISVYSMVSEKWLLEGLRRSEDLVNMFYNALFAYNYNTTVWLREVFPFACLDIPFGWYMHLQSQSSRTAVGKIAPYCLLHVPRFSALTQTVCQ